MELNGQFCFELLPIKSPGQIKMEYKRKFQKRPNMGDVQIEMIHDGKAYITKLVPYNLKVM